MFNTKCQNCNQDDCLTLFHYCLVHLISLRGVGVQMNAKKNISNITQVHACNKRLPSLWRQLSNLTQFQVLFRLCI